ncbi:MAG: 50S ribosomal protein L17 [Candidatus Margulisiibacteriota bacterium]
MRHQKGNKKLGKPTDQRIALLRTLVVSLVEFKKITTTDTRASEAQRFVERLITLSKKGDLHSRRIALSLLPNKSAVSELFKTIGPKFSSRNGGYTRVTKLGFRRGDAAPVSLLEFVEQ